MPPLMLKDGSDLASAMHLEVTDAIGIVILHDLLMVGRVDMS